MPGMGPPDIPFEFDVRTVVFLVRPDDAPDLPEVELDRLQEEHLAYGASLFARGSPSSTGRSRTRPTARCAG